MIIADMPPAVAELCPLGPSELVDRLEAEMRRLPPVEIEPVHHFADGIYCREITIKAGTLLTGKIHRTHHINIISRGSILVWTKENGVKRINAPFTFIAPPGTRRVGLAITDCVWTTVHANPDNTRDLAVLEDNLIVPHSSKPLIEAQPSPLCLGSQQP